MSEPSGRGEAEFTALLAPHVERLYRLAFRLTGRVADAEDLVQEVLVKAYERRAEVARIEALGPWLGRVLYNAFIDEKRRFARGRGREVGLAAAEVAAAPGGRAENEALDIVALGAALDKLSREHSSVVMLHDAEGYGLAEIEALTGVALGTLKSRLHRARARLRELLAGDGTF